MTASNPPESLIEYESPDCPLCGCDAADHLFTARDRLLGQPGEFPVVRCATCGFVFLKPRPTPETLVRYYRDTYYPLDEEQASLEALEVAQGLLQRVQIWTSQRGWAEARILDIGCGTGLFLKLARDAGFDVQGIELSQSAVDYARTVYGLPLHCGDVTSVELPKASFDVITMWHVLEHLRDPVDALRRVNRLLKPGGLLLCGIPNIASFEARAFGRRWFSLDAPRHLVHFSPSTAAMAVCAADLEVERIVHSNGTAGLVYSIMGDLTGVSLKLRKRQLSEDTYHRIAGVLRWLTRPLCASAAKLGRGGAIEVYAVKPAHQLQQPAS